MERMNLAAPGDTKGAVTASWNTVPTARAYFLSAIGGSGDDMVLWSSSDLPEAGLGLMDYLANAQIDQWVIDKVLLPESARQCAIPSGIFGNAGGAVLRGIAYGNELNLLHPPRPADPRLLAAWDPEWSLRVRVKSTSMAILGQEAALRTNAEEGGTDQSARHPAQGDLRPLAGEGGGGEPPPDAGANQSAVALALAAAPLIPAASRRSFALSVISHMNSGSSRPKCP